jgi:hypothetical protein
VASSTAAVFGSSVTSLIELSAVIVAWVLMLLVSPPSGCTMVS